MRSFSDAPVLGSHLNQVWLVRPSTGYRLHVSGACGEASSTGKNCAAGTYSPMQLQNEVDRAQRASEGPMLSILSSMSSAMLFHFFAFAVVIGAIPSPQFKRVARNFICFLSGRTFNEGRTPSQLIHVTTTSSSNNLSHLHWGERLTLECPTLVKSSNLCL